MQPIALSNRRWLWAVAYLGLWTGFALLSAVEAFVAQKVEGKPVPWTLVLGRGLKDWYSFGLIALGILWFAGRVRFDARHVSRWVGLHMVAALLFSLGYVALLSALMAGEKSVQTGEVLTFSHLFQTISIYYFVAHLTLYWLVVLGHLSWTNYRQSRERERQAAALATELVQARLQALRMQINPHFLFNTLNSVSALIHEQPAAADRMIVRLSELLRQTLDRGDTQEVPLREEIEFLKGYLEIEQMRFQDRLRVHFAVEPATLDLLVPNLILQPLVENAIRHSIEPREEGGRVEVSVRLIGGELELRVWDDGGGLPADATAPGRAGIGLSNVRSRLAHLYGSAQQLAVRNAAGGGTEALARIPCCRLDSAKGPRVVVLEADSADDPQATLAASPSAKQTCC